MNKGLYAAALGVVLTLRSVGAAQAFTAIDLGTLPGFTHSCATHVSDGQVVGYANGGSFVYLMTITPLIGTIHKTQSNRRGRRESAKKERLILSAIFSVLRASAVSFCSPCLAFSGRLGVYLRLPRPPSI
jgi:hypothetical protein